MPVLDSSALAELPGRAREHLAQLHGEGRWAGTDDIDADLELLTTVAGKRSRDADAPPFGLVHSEFHPSSVHIGAEGHGWRLLDLARAFVGPGLVDLVSWFGTITEPQPDAIRHLLHAYVAAGGSTEVLNDRAGLDAASWGLGWHRLWAVEWFLDQAHRWMPEPANDAHSAKVVRRHLREARQALAA